MLTNLSKKQKYILLIGAFLAMALLIFMEYKDNMKSITDNSVNQNKVDAEILYETNSRTNFYTYKKNVYYCTKDGMQMLNSKGKTLWSDTFTMVTPYINYDGEIVGVCEEGGKSLYVYNSNGILYRKDMEYPITSFSVNLNGYASVITKGESEYKIMVITSSGEVISESIIALVDGIPVATDVSNDNKVYAVSLININDIKMQTRVVFYYVGKKSVTEEETVDMFASFKRDDQIAPIIKFMDNNNFIVVTDKEIIGVEINNQNGERYKEKWAKELKNKVTAIDFPENKFIAVAYGESFINADEPEEKGTVKWYNTSGEEINVHKSEKAVISLTSDYGATIINSGRNFKAISYKGGEIWNYNAIQDVDSMMFVENTNNVLFITPKKAEIFDVKKKITEIEEDESEDTSTESSSEKTSESSTETVTQTQSETTTKIQKEETTEITTKAKKEETTETTTKAKKEEKTETTTKIQKEEITQTTETTTKLEPVTEQTTQEISTVKETETTTKSEPVTEQTTKQPPQTSETTTKAPEIPVEEGPVMPE